MSAIQQTAQLVSNRPRREYIGVGRGKYLPHQNRRECARRRLQPAHGGNWRAHWRNELGVWP